MLLSARFTWSSERHQAAWS